MTWSPRALRALAMLLGALLLVVAYWWWQGRSRPVVTLPEQVPVASASPSTSATSTDVVTVHVRGRVREPGVLSLPVGSRVVDAIEAAGGLRPGASTGELNLARVLVDGEQVAGVPLLAADRVSSPTAVEEVRGFAGDRFLLVGILLFAILSVAVLFGRRRDRKTREAVRRIGRKRI